MSTWAAQMPSERGTDTEVTAGCAARRWDDGMGKRTPEGGAAHVYSSEGSWNRKGSDVKDGACRLCLTCE